MKNTDTTDTSFLLIGCSAHQFALPISCIQKILPTLPVTPIPFVPECVAGLINVDGTIALQVDLATLCGTTNAAKRSELILIETGRALCALHVDQTQERCTLVVQPLQTDQPPIPQELLQGEALHKERTIFILDPQKIGGLIRSDTLPDGGSGTLGKRINQHEAEDNTTIASLVVSNGEEQYAFELQSVVEILEACDYTPIPDAPIGLLGFCLLRQQTIPVMDLARLINPNAASTEHTRLIVVERDGIHYGLLINQLIGVKKFPFDSFQPVVDGNQLVSGLFIHENITTLLLSPRQIISDALAGFLAPYTKQHTEQRSEQKEETLSFLKITLCQKPFVIPLHNIKRILPFFPMTPLDDDKENICGAINVEGKVIPVLSIESILRMEQQQRRNEYLIVGDTTQDWAICVEAAQHIIRIPLSSIHSETTTDTRLLSGIARVEEELIPLLNPNLFSQRQSL